MITRVKLQGQRKIMVKLTFTSTLSEMAASQT